MWRFLAIEENIHKGREQGMRNEEGKQEENKKQMMDQIPSHFTLCL